MLEQLPPRVRAFGGGNSGYRNDVRRNAVDLQIPRRLAEKIVEGLVVVIIRSARRAWKWIHPRIPQPEM